MVVRGRLLVVLLMLAMSAWMAPLAQAFTWNVEGWKVGPPPVTALAGGESETVSTTLAAGEITLKGEVLAEKITIKATELASVNANINQAGAIARDAGQLVFKKAKFTVGPEGCEVNGGNITTRNLVSEVVKPALTVYDKLSPEAGETILVLEIKNCIIAGNFALKGTEFAQMEPLGKQLVEQPLTFSPAILAGAGGAITLGVKPAELTFSAKMALSGGKAGSKFWVE